MTIEHSDQFYIDGRWRTCTASARTAVINPASEQLVGDIALGGLDDVELAVAAARRAFPTFSQTSVEERVALLGRILELSAAFIAIRFRYFPEGLRNSLAPSDVGSRPLINRAGLRNRRRIRDADCRVVALRA